MVVQFGLWTGGTQESAAGHWVISGEARRTQPTGHWSRKYGELGSQKCRSLGLHLISTSTLETHSCDCALGPFQHSSNQSTKYVSEFMCLLANEPLFWALYWLRIC